jgi:hypothetical protein
MPFLSFVLIEVIVLFALMMVFLIDILGEINTFLLHLICKVKRATLSALCGQKAMLKKHYFLIFQIK